MKYLLGTAYMDRSCKKYFSKYSFVFVWIFSDVATKADWRKHHQSNIDNNNIHTNERNENIIVAVHLILLFSVFSTNNDIGRSLPTVVAVKPGTISAFLHKSVNLVCCWTCLSRTTCNSMCANRGLCYCMLRNMKITDSPTKSWNIL